MKDRRAILILFIVFALILSTSVFARKGVGIVWNTETEIVNEGSKHCIEYGVYNPWEDDVKATLGVSSELEDVIVEMDTEAKFIKAGTLHDMAVPVDFCFEIADVYSKDCLLGNFVCEKRCEESEIVYEGKVMAREEGEEGAEGAVGSATSLGVAVPLRLRVKCSAYARDYTLVYAVVIVVALILILWIVYRKHKRKGEIIKES